MTAEYAIGIDWNGDGDYSGPGEIVTERALARTGLTIRYGRDQARALAPVSAGEAGLEVNNQSRDYSPENSSSPLAGMLMPGRPVRITGTVAGSTYGMFAGRTADYELHPEIGRRSVQLTCLDALASLRGVRISTALHHGLRTGEAIGVVLDAAGWPEDLRDLDVGATVVPWFWASDADAFDLLLQLVASEGPPALVTSDGDGRIVFRDRHHRLVRPASLAPQATLASAGAEPLTSSLVYDHGWRELVNTVAFSPVVRQLSGQLSTVWSADSTISIADGQTVSIAATASAPFAGAVAPAAGIDYQLRSGTVTMALSRISGQSTTVHATATGGPAVIAGLQVRAYLLETVTTVQVVAEDPVSIGRYGRRSLPSSQDPVWASVEDARAIADLIIGQRAERLPTVTVTLRGANDVRLAKQLSLDLSDRVTIVDDETSLDADFYVEQIKHEINSDGLHVTTLGCEKVRLPVSNVFTFDVAGRGFDDGVFGGTGLDDPDNIFRFDTPGQGFDNGVFAT